VPPYLLAIVEDACENSWNSLPICSGVMTLGSVLLACTVIDANVLLRWRTLGLNKPRKKIRYLAFLLTLLAVVLQVSLGTEIQVPPSLVLYEPDNLQAISTTLHICDSCFVSWLCSSTFGGVILSANPCRRNVAKHRPAPPTTMTANGR
jgi:hypothetical protein